MGPVRILLILCLLLPASLALRAQEIDSDADGLSDRMEQALLTQFVPNFMVGRSDCSEVPAEFSPNLPAPAVKAENGTIYGEVFRPGGYPVDTVEVHFYHLWRQDCGRHGHPLDAEHVAVLVRGDAEGGWRALYWYAAAHEDTVCDVSQIAHASTLNAVDHGAKVWISPGKHASYLNQTLCARGCGADRCQTMTPLRVARLINLGEPSHPMNQSLFLASSAWPLAGKMQRTNFPAAPVARLESLPDTEIAWFRPGKHPAQGVIAISSSIELSLAAGEGNTSAALGEAGGATSDAISVAEHSTEGALGTSYHKTVGALGSSARHVGKALGLTRDDPK